MRRKYWAIVAAIIIGMISLTGCGGGFTAADEVNVVALGRQVFGDLTITGYVYTYGERSGERQEIENAIYEFLDRFNADLSAKETTSYLYKFNRKIGGTELPDGWTRYEIDEHAFRMLSSGAELSDKTEGYFDPTVYPLMQLWGLRTGEYNNPDAHRGALPTSGQVAQIRETYCGLDKIRLSASDGKYYAAKDERADASIDGKAYTTMLDLGAQAKGYAADRIKDLLAGFTQVSGASFSLSGNTYLYGKFPETKKKGDRYYKTGEADFISGVLDPSPENLFGLPLVGFPVDATGGVSVVTSGDYVRRYYMLDGQYWDGSSEPPVSSPEEVTYFCHIVDPKTGFPCNIDPTERTGQNKYFNRRSDALTSVSVLSDSSELADVYATAVMLMGMEKGIAWLEANGEEAFLIGCDGRYASLLNDREILNDPETYTFSYAGYRAVAGYGI